VSVSKREYDVKFLLDSFPQILEFFGIISKYDLKEKLDKQTVTRLLFNNEDGPLFGQNIGNITATVEFEVIFFEVYLLI
jgi:hypothetical protein